MSAYKDDKTGKWFVFFYYRDWQGKNKGKTKRGFVTKREALEWERNFLFKQNANLEMAFGEFVKLYTEDMKPKLKLNTWLSKEHVINSKLLPYFGDRKINDIKAADILKWQNVMIEYKKPNGKPYSKVYLKTIHDELACIFNHAVRYYNLSDNPARKAGNMGKDRGAEMLFWTNEEYSKFADVVKDKPRSYYAFEILYWCGIREGELLALTMSDFDLTAQTLRISKSYQRLQGKDVITDPKTAKSNRTIALPDFLCDEIRDYFNMLYKLEPSDRIFDFSKSFLHHEMDRGSKIAGVKRIRIHDLRHSNISLLINMGFTAVDIANRVGHESIRITYRYGHMFPNKQREMADKLNMKKFESEVNANE
ncbi:MAG: tyrosine-type recombinase/integrase [Lachnospiraceae bacterium]